LSNLVLLIQLNGESQPVVNVFDLAQSEQITDPHIEVNAQ